MALTPFPTEFPMSEAWQIALQVWTGGGVPDKRAAALVIWNAVGFAGGKFLAEPRPVLMGVAKPKSKETPKAYLLRLAKAQAKLGPRHNSEAAKAVVGSFDWMKLLKAFAELLMLLLAKKESNA